MDQVDSIADRLSVLEKARELDPEKALFPESKENSRVSKIRD